jgi:hypothetical protein
MLNFCNYYARGLTLYESMMKHTSEEFQLYVLCLDEKAEQLIQKQGKSNLIPIKLSDLEAQDSELLACKQHRSIVEYFFTLSPCLPLYLFKNFHIDSVCYLDSDLYFFDDPSLIYKESKGKSIFITEHNFPKEQQHLEAYGKFNVGCQVYLNNETGNKCLERWRAQCIEWCYDKLEETRFADQKYLDEWPSLYKNELRISTHEGINLAPWNLVTYNIEVKDKAVRINNKPLIFFHFQGLRYLGGKWFSHSLSRYNLKPNKLYINYIYKPYLTHYHRNLQKALQTKETALRLTQSISWVKKLKMIWKKEAIRA